MSTISKQAFHFFAIFWISDRWQKILQILPSSMVAIQMLFLGWINFAFHVYI